MSAYQKFLAPSNASSASFKAWAQEIDNAFANFGWTQTSDTGQVNWAGTITVPSVNTFPYYSIWQPSDALQTGSTAFYVKVEYGTNSGGASSPQFRFTVGTGSNGSGSLTGTTMGPFTLPNFSIPDNNATPMECNYSGDTARCGAMLFRNYWQIAAASGLCEGFVIERTRDSSGSYNSDGVCVIQLAYSNTVTVRVLGFSAGVSGGASLNPATYSPFTTTQIAGYSGTSLVGTKTYAAAIALECGTMFNPATGMLVMHQQDGVEGGIVQYTQYGSTRTGIMSKNGPLGNNGGSGPSGQYMIVFRYD